MKSIYPTVVNQSAAAATQGTGEPSRAALLLRRRGILALLLGVPALALLGCGDDTTETPGSPLPEHQGVAIPDVRGGEDIFAYIERVKGSFDQDLYKGILGAANEFKEGDVTQNIHAADAASRVNARALLSNTTIGALVAQPIFEDAVSSFIESVVEPAAAQTIAPWTMGELKAYLLSKTEDEIKSIMGGLTSDTIACVVKLMKNEELISVGQKVFNPLPGSNIGAKGYMGARIQPNSPTDNVDDITFQVFDAWAYAVGDVVIGTNPVSSEVESVHAVEEALKELRVAFGLEAVLPHCVLAHIDVQAKVEEQFPGSTALWFQSLAGVEDANAVFDVTVEKMKAHAAKRAGQYGLYFETGQGADVTNGQGKGFDIVIHESRKYGFARGLKAEVAKAQRAAGMDPPAPWVHVNDVAGFIGPEVFRTREQLVRVCLEDTVMGKLHGLTIGLDVCSTLHMDVTLDDLDWCIDQIMPVNPAYLMGLPTKNDPMLSYLTTAYQDHVRVRSKFGYKVDETMWAFFRDTLEVVDNEGRPTANFGDPAWVYMKYRRAKGESAKTDQELIGEGRAKIAEIRARGVFIAEGHGENPWDLEPSLDKMVRDLYDDAKKCIWAELPANFAMAMGISAPVAAVTQSKDREDYILHPATGEVLDEVSVKVIDGIRDAQAGKYDVQIVISDGLDALSLTDNGHLKPYLEKLATELSAAGFKLARERVILTTGRVRAGYRVGEHLYGSLADPSSERSVLHIIGERPGNGHHTFSCYMTKAKANLWGQAGVIDHNHTKVVANIADSALDPTLAAVETVSILKSIQL
jgi:ethanolamine ammonia-lyase large subunit